MDTPITLMITIEIPNYLTHVQLTKGRRPKYYTKGTHIPKKYQKYKSFDSKGRLLDDNKKPLIANPASVNKPRIKKINGQELYSGNMPPHLRSKVVACIKESFVPYLKKVKPVQDFPIRLEAELHTVPGTWGWDLDNQWIYHKCFQDALVAQGIIPDDNIYFITQAPSFSYCPVERLEDRKLVYRITTDDRPIITSHTQYKNHITKYPGYQKNDSAKQILLESSSADCLLNID